MARSYWTDPLLSCNFALIEVPCAAAVPFVLAFPIKTAMSAIQNGNFVGMQSVSIPTLSLEMEEIKVGNTGMTHRVPSGYSSGGDLVLSHAVMARGLDMYAWFMQAFGGRFGPRRDLMVCHTRLDKALPARILLCRDCIPTSYQPSNDFAGDAAQICMETLTLYTPWIDIIPISASDAAPGAF